MPPARPGPSRRRSGSPPRRGGQVRLGAEQASFFVRTLLPGSEDCARAVAEGCAMDADFSRYDGFHPVFEHGATTREEWTAAYRAAWRRFCRPDAKVAALGRCATRGARIDLVRNLAWYRWSAFTERTHPMIAGSYRFRS